MILDTYDNIPNYLGLTPNLDAALRFLQSQSFSSLPDGRNDIGGPAFFALLQTYTTKPQDQCRLEAHRKHIDIQCLLKGTEHFGYAPVPSLTPETPYDPARDVAFFKGPVDWLTLREGLFVIAFPQDAHLPCVNLPEGPTEVRKLVLKVAVA